MSNILGCSTSLKYHQLSEFSSKNLPPAKALFSLKPVFKAKVLETLGCGWNAVAFSSFEAPSLLPVFQAFVSGPLKSVISLQLLETNPHA